MSVTYSQEKLSNWKVKIFSIGSRLTLHCWNRLNIVFFWVVKLKKEGFLGF